MNPALQKALIKKLVNEEMAKQRKVWLERCIQAVSACIAADLLDKWDWKPDDVTELLESVSSAFDSMDADYASIDDYIKSAEDRNIGIKFV
jgi:uncharacterized hydantoinase/oxoprolinase family protein